MKKYFTFIFFLLPALSLLSQDQAGIIYGNDFAYTVIAPDNWILDDETWANNGIHGLFYPEEYTSFSVRNPFIYINQISKMREDVATLEQWIEKDFKKTSQRESEVTKKVIGIKNYGNRDFFLVEYNKLNTNFFELIAYHEYMDKIFFIVLVTQSERERTILSLKLEQLLTTFAVMDRE